MAHGAWLDEVKRALGHVRGSDATEVEVAHPGFRLRLRRRPGVGRRVGNGGGLEPVLAGGAVLAPLTGVFYRASSPTAPPYTREGDTVQSETVVGLIEAMKIFNEVLAERRGRVREIVAEPGQLVQAGELLMWIDEVVDAANGSGHP